VYWGIGEVIRTAETRNTRSKICTSAIFPTKSSTLTRDQINKLKCKRLYCTVHKYNLQHTLNKCEMYFCIIIKVARSVLRRATGWTIWKSNLVGARFKSPFLGPPSLLYNAYRVITGGKAAGAWR